MTLLSKLKSTLHFLINIKRTQLHRYTQTLKSLTKCLQQNIWKILGNVWKIKLLREKILEKHLKMVKFHRAFQWEYVLIIMVCCILFSLLYLSLFHLLQYPVCNEYKECEKEKLTISNSFCVLHNLYLLFSVFVHSSCHLFHLTD